MVLWWFSKIAMVCNDITARPWKRDHKSDIMRFKDCCYNKFCKVGKNHWVWWFSNVFWVSHIPSLQSTFKSISPKWHLQVQRRGQRESPWDCWCPRRGCRNRDFHFKPISLRFARMTSSGTSKIKNCSSNSGTQLYWDFVSENVWYPNSQEGCVSNILVEIGKKVVPPRFPNKKTSLYRFLWNCWKRRKYRKCFNCNGIQ